MDGNTIYSNEFFRIFNSADDVYIETTNNGFPAAQISSIISSCPDVSFVNLNTIIDAFTTVQKQPQKIGKMKIRVNVSIIDNDLKAIVVYNLRPEELDIKNRESLIRETCDKLNENGIIYGIKREIFFGSLSNGIPYVIAEGIPAINGTDSIIRMYELKEAKPEIHEDGKVDFYHLKLINLVKKDEWLGERINATPGVPGQSIKGTPISPMNGKNFPLNYDRASVREVVEVEKTVLYSNVNGAVNYIDGKIIVANHLQIDGNVDFRTGNIKFDGYVTINGTIADGFSVEAVKDVEINGDLGLGNIKELTSIQGSIFIKGGVASKGRVEIKAAKNVYTKFIDNASITCGETAHIGFYSINSTLTAKKIVVDSSNGHIIGGNIKAEFGVIAPIIGSEIEKRTVIEVTGFDRSVLKEQLDSTFQKVSEMKNEQQKLKLLLAKYDGQGQLNQFQSNDYERNFNRLAELKDQIKAEEEKCKSLSEYLKTRGDGEICATKKIYPNCMLIIKRNILETSSITPATAFFIQDGKLKQI